MYMNQKKTKNTILDTFDESDFDAKTTSLNLQDVSTRLVYDVRRATRLHDRIQSILHGKSTEVAKSLAPPNNVVACLNVAHKELNNLTDLLDRLIGQIETSKGKETQAVSGTID